MYPESWTHIIEAAAFLSTCPGGETVRPKGIVFVWKRRYNQNQLETTHCKE